MRPDMPIEQFVRPLDALRETYGETLQIERPRVRLIEGVPAQEPIVHGRIRGAARFLEATKLALAVHRAEVRDAAC